MKKIFILTILFLITLVYSIQATVIIKSHSQTIAGTITLYIYANTSSGEGVAAQARYGAPYSYITWVSGSWNELGSGDSYTNYTVILTGLPSSGSVDFEACKVKPYGTIEGQFEWTGFVYSVNPVLPVELSSFTADIIGNEINLNWKTATEVNNYGFNVERASTSLGIEWKKIGFVNGSGNSNSPKEYSYIDKTAAAGNYTYRLKQIDNDGQFKYSPEVEVSVNSIVNGYTLEQNYPNPFNPTTSIKFGFNNDTEVNLLVFDQIGNQVATLFNGKAEAGRIYNAEFNAEGLSSGIYFYRLETPLKSEVRKMLLIK